jgi:hypothetical protein
MIIILMIAAAAVVFGIAFTIGIQTKNRSGKWGLNLNSPRAIFSGNPLLRKVACPKCGREQQGLRLPANTSEALWGGWTCPNCGTRMDKWGRART